MEMCVCVCVFDSMSSTSVCTVWSIEDDGYDAWHKNTHKLNVMKSTANSIRRHRIDNRKSQNLFQFRDLNLCRIGQARYVRVWRIVCPPIVFICKQIHSTIKTETLFFQSIERLSNVCLAANIFVLVSAHSRTLRLLELIHVHKIYIFIEDSLNEMCVQTLMDV